MTYLAQSLILFSNPSTNLPVPPPAALGDIVAINYGTSNVATSSNGSTWGVYSLSLPSGQWEDVIFSYNHQAFIAIRSGVSSAAYISGRGVVWLDRGFSIPNVQHTSLIAEGNNKIVVMGTTTTSSGYAYNNANSNLFWTNGTLPKSIAQGCLTFGDGKFVVMAANNGFTSNKNIGFYSSDGINWTEFNTPVSTPGWKSVEYGRPAPGVSGDSNQWVAISGNTSTTSAVAAYSTNAITWTSASLPQIDRYVDLAYSPNHNRWVALSENGYFAVSTNSGQTWSALTSGDYQGRGYNRIVFTDIGFVATSSFNNGTVVVSTNGLDWTRYSPSTLNIGNSRWLALGTLPTQVGEVINAVTNTLANTTNIRTATAPVKFNTLSLELPPPNLVSSVDRPDGTIPFTRPTSSTFTLELWRYYVPETTTGNSAWNYFTTATINFFVSEDQFTTVIPTGTLFLKNVQHAIGPTGAPAGTLDNNKWIHYLLVANNTHVRVGYGGYLGLSSNILANNVMNSASLLNFNHTTYSSKSAGFVDDVRISNGDIYNVLGSGSSTYTVPTSALTVTSNTHLLIKPRVRT